MPRPSQLLRRQWERLSLGSHGRAGGRRAGQTRPFAAGCPGALILSRSISDLSPSCARPRRSSFSAAARAALHLLPRLLERHPLLAASAQLCRQVSRATSLSASCRLSSATWRSPPSPAPRTRAAARWRHAPPPARVQLALQLSALLRELSHVAVAALVVKLALRLCASARVSSSSARCSTSSAASRSSSLGPGDTVL